MYGLDDQIDLSFLIAKEVFQVCVGVHNLVFQFSDHISINVESICHIFQTNAELHDTWVSGTPLKTALVFNCLGKIVKSVNGKSDGTLSLLLGDDLYLEILDSNSEFESYNICHGEEIIIV